MSQSTTGVKEKVCGRFPFTKQIRGWRQCDQELIERVITLGRTRIRLGKRYIRTQREAIFMGMRVLDRALRDPTLWNAVIESRRREEIAAQSLCIDTGPEP